MRRVWGSKAGRIALVVAAVVLVAVTAGPWIYMNVIREDPPDRRSFVARRNGATIEVTGSLTVVFDEWGIPNPSTGPVSTEDHGELELLLVFGR